MYSEMGPPALYDTSVSSDEHNNSRSFQVYGRTHPKHWNHQHAATTAAGMASSPEFRFTSMAHQSLPSYAQSEPGVRILSSSDPHDRFAAYINRFAELDPRMDHRYPPEQSTVATTTPSTLTASAIAAATRSNTSQSQESLGSRTTPVAGGIGPARLAIPSETASDFILSSSANHYNQSPSQNRTRELARRFEQRRQKRLQKLEQQQQQQTPPPPLLANQKDETHLLATKPAPSSPEIATCSSPRQPIYERVMSEQRGAPRRGGRSKSLPPTLRSRNNNMSNQYHARHNNLNDSSFTTTTTMMENEDNNRNTNAIILQNTPQHQTPALPESPSASTSRIIRWGERAEIEMPSPATVRDLKMKIWDHDEVLQDQHAQQYKNRRSVRSLSPRRQRQLTSSQSQKSSSTESGNFQSRYYQAAQRGWQSPDRSLLPQEHSTQQPRTLDMDSRQKGESVPQKTNFLTQLNKTNMHELQDHPTHSRELLSSSKQAIVFESSTSMKNHDVRASSTAAEETVATLIAQLGNINRDDPRAALEQIDEILRRGGGWENMNNINNNNKDGSSSSNGGHVIKSQGSRSIKTQDPTQQEHEELERNEEKGDNDEEDDEDSDSETTVSSITDPTYQEMKKNFEQEFQASTAAASGMPRPSTLQKYTHSTAKSSTANHQISDDLHPTTTTTTDASAQESKKASKDREERSSTPPTETIHVTKNNASKEKVNINRPTVADLFNVATSGGPAFLERFERLMAPKPDDVSLTHSAEIEQKIKKWDDMSTGIIPNTGADTPKESTKSPLSCETTETIRSGMLVDEGSSPSLRRAHPWDASIPARMGKVSVRDTSMESADGVEAQFEPKYPSAKLSPDRSDISPVRRMRKDRLSRELKKTTGGGNADQPHLPRLDEGSCSFSTMSSRQQATTKSLSEDFDSAWVNLPSSSYFRNSNSPVAEVTSNSRTSPREAPKPRFSPLESGTYVSSVDEVEARNTHDADASGIVHQNQSNEYCEQEVEVKYLPKVSQRPDLQTISPRSEDEPPSRDYAYTPQYKENSVRIMITQTDRGDDVGRSHSSDTIRLANSSESSGNSKPRNRGLRAFLKRKQASKVPQPNDIISTGSRRFRDYSIRPLQKEMDCTGAHSRDGEEQTMVISASLGRKSARSRSPNHRSRARSLENIRNPNIARKFSRLLRVYDDLEETKPGYMI